MHKLFYIQFKEIVKGNKRRPSEPTEFIGTQRAETSEEALLRYCIRTSVDYDAVRTVVF